VSGAETDPTTASGGGATAPDPAEVRLLERLRAGDQAAFTELVDRHSAAMLRVAQLFVPSRAVAEEVVQETWVGVLRGLEGFEGRSTLRTWLFRILTNRAKTRGERESRTVPFSALAARETEGDEAAVDPDRFTRPEGGGPGFWAEPPRRWEESPERSLQSGEAVELVRGVVEKLPPAQRLVIMMRDLEDWPSADVCNALEISETNQRVLLHRARSKVRAALEDYFDA
jgi:RNA polymerase sigma-70 factor, ECF subfamily